MDAAQKLLKNAAKVTAAALFLTTAGLAQTPVLSASNPTPSFNSVNSSATTSLTSSGAQITFSTSTAYLDSDQGWLRVEGGTTTPAFFTFSLARQPQSEGLHQATVTFTPSDPAGVAPVSITVSYTSGNTGGGGGGSSTLTANPSPIFLSAAANSNSGAVTVNIGTSGANNVTIAGVSVTLNSGTNVSWLSASITNATVIPGTPGSISVIGYSSGLANGNYSGTVTVTPSTGSALNITVNFTVGGGGGGGNGNWTVNPTSISWNYSTGGVFSSQDVSVSAPSGASSYRVDISSTNGWLLVNANGSQSISSISNIPPTTPFNLQVGSNVNTLSAGVYTPTVRLTDNNNNQYTLTVTLTVNGGNSNGLTITPSPLTFTSALNGSTQSQVVSLVSNVGGAVTVSGIGATPGWLSATGPSPANVVASQQSTFTVSANPFGLSAGTYSSSIAVAIGAQSGTLTVTLVVGSGGNGGGTGTTAVAPTSLNFYYQLNTNPAFIAQQKLVITGPAGSWSSTISSGASWLRISPASGSALPNPANSGDNPIVSIDPTGLSTGTYNGTIGITTGGGTQNVLVTLNVVANTILLPTPGALIFTAQTGQPKPAGQSVYFSNSDSQLNVNTQPISAVAGASWITPTVGVGFVSIDVDQSSLTTGVYSSSISVSQTGAANSPVQVPILLVVNGGGTSGGNGTLTFSQNSVSFSSSNGVVTPSSTVLNVSSASATSFVGSISYSPNNVGNWLTVTPLSSVTPVNLSLSASASGLNTGTYSATISFNVNGVIQTIPVTLAVNTSTGGNTGNVNVAPTSLTFSALQGANPAAQSVSVTSASGSAGIPVTVQVTSGATWLSTSANSSNTTPVTLTVNVSSGTMQPGTYNGNIQIQPNGGTAVNIPVALTITAPPSVSATPTTLTFDYRAGDNAPATKPVTVSGGGSSLAFTATATSNGGWLIALPATGTTPGTVNVGVNPSGLATGIYNGSVTVSGASGAPGATTISVTLNVTAPLPTITKVTNAASYAQGSVAPGEIITLFADDPTHPIGPTTAAGLTLDSAGKVSTTIGGVQVLINGFACPMIYASASQISAVVPYELKLFSTATVQVKFLGQTSNGVPVNMATTIPGIFTANSSGTGPGAILNSNSTTNSASNPATRGDVVVVYLTGEGETSPGGTTGKVTTVAAPPQPLTPAPLLPISVTVGGQPANWSFAGEAPGFVSGVLQLNVVTPTNVAAGNQNIVVTIGGNQSQQGVTVALR